MATATAYPAHFKGVKELVDSGVDKLPSIYVRPQEERPSACPIADNFPIIDLSSGLQGHGELREAVVRDIGRACKDWGFFQVINHGVPNSVIDRMFSAAQEFHDLPSEDKMHYFSTDVRSRMRYATSFNVKEDKVLNWRDFLRHDCIPLLEMRELWPEKPACYRDATADYSTQVRRLGKLLLGLISESLGLPADYIDQRFGGYSQIMATNYYPACPEPELTLGIAGHSDPAGITLLMQDQVGGLQVLHNGEWVFVKPIPYAFVINIADQLQILTNDRYKSIEHRAVVNSRQARMSIPTAFGPAMESILQPAVELVDEEHPALYKPSRYGDFMLSLQSHSLNPQETEVFWFLAAQETEVF